MSSFIFTQNVLQLSGIVQEPLKPERQTATLASLIDIIGIEKFIFDSQILKKRDPPGLT